MPLQGTNLFSRINLHPFQQETDPYPTKILSYAENGDVNISDYSELTKSEIYTIHESSVSNIRNDQPSFVTLDNGDVLCAFNHFGASGSDIDTAYIAGKLSSDGGKTWGSVFTLQSNASGAINTLVPSLYKRDDGKILMLFLVTTEPVPTPESKIYKKVFNQDITVFEAETEIPIATGYYSPGSDRIFKDDSNGNLLYSTSVLVSGTGVSFGSVYKSTILISEDEGATWTNIDLSIGVDKLILNNTIGGSTEPGIYYTPQGLVCYFRTLTGYTYAVMLDEDYLPAGEEFILFPSANAMSSVKWIESLNGAAATRTRLLDNNPIGDNVRKYLDILVSTDGIYNWSVVDEIDHAIQDTNWYVNQPVIFEYNNKVLVGYNKSVTGSNTASLLLKIYPKNFLKYSYTPEPETGISQDRGRLISGIQEIYSNNDTRNASAVHYPKGGIYSFLGPSKVGAFKITLPNNKNAFITIKGFIYINSDNSSLSFEISCNTSDMTINTVRIDGYRVSTNINVRFVNGTNPKIFIGELTKNWVYPSLIITEVSGFFDTRLNDISEGWNVDIEPTSFGTVVSTKNPINNVVVEGGTTLLKDGTAGINLKMERGTGGVAWGQGLNSDDLILYNKALDSVKQRWHASGRSTIGGLTDAGFMLDVQGTFRSSGTATVATPTEAGHAVTKGYADALARPYKVYTAIINQTGTSAPTATVLENTLGGTVAFTYTSVGTYVATLTGAFTADKTICFVHNNPAWSSSPGAPTGISAFRIDNNTVGIRTVSTSPTGMTDGAMINASFEIRVYN